MANRLLLRLGTACSLSLSLTAAQAQPAPAAQAQAPRATPPSAPQFLTQATAVRALDEGLEARAGEATLRISALRDDVLRVRISPSATLPEDASWAVLPEARTRRIKVTPLPDSPQTAGFRTAALEVRLEKNPLRLVILDRQGQVLSADALHRPTQFVNGGFQVTKEMPLDEHYFGLGDKPGPLDRRDMAFTMWNTDAYRHQESTDPLYKSIPFFMAVRAGRAHGILLDNTWRSNFNFGKQWHDAYSFGSDGGPLDYYVLHGPSPKKVLEGYAFLTGPSPLPPMWALGFQQSRFSYEPESQVREIASRLRSDRIPSDVLFLDIDFQDRKRPFTIDQQKFPNFAVLLKDLHAQNLHVVTVTDLHVPAVPNAGYAPYDTGVAGNHFIHNPDGSIFTGPVWPGPSAFPDFTRAATRAWWGALHQDFVQLGVDGFWNDMNEPSVFETPLKTMPRESVHRIEEPGFASRNATHAELHNVLGTQNARATYDGLLKLKPNERPFVLTRATYAGGQRYAITWTGDNSATWNHLRLSTPMLLNLGLSGFSFAGVDSGGFSGSPSPELLTRWTQVAAFNPLHRNHSEKHMAPHEVWANGPGPLAVRRSAIETRYRLMPYLYTLAEETSRTGIPMMRPLFLEFPEAAPDKHPLDLWAGNQFLLGRSLMVVPPPYADAMDAYRPTLPQVDWFDFWTGRKVVKEKENPTAPDTQPLVAPKITPTLEVLPVFVRAGSILPLQPLVQSTNEKPQGALELRVYPGPECQGSLYLDDGRSLDYKKGAYLRQEFTCEASGDTVRVKLAAPTGKYQPWWKNIDVVVYGWEQPGATATLASGGKLTARHDATARTVRVTVPASAQGAELRLTKGTP